MNASVDALPRLPRWPTADRDSKHGAMVMDLLQELHAEGATICMVTHGPRYAGRATRTVHLLNGRIVDDSGAARPPFNDKAMRPSAATWEPTLRDALHPRGGW